MEAQIPQTQPEVLTQADVMARYQISRSTLWRLREDGSLPRPLVIGGQLLRWPLAALLEWEAKGCPTVKPGQFDVRIEKLVDSDEQRFPNG